MSEKPLHVRVAEALGGNPFWSTRRQWECKCGDECEHTDPVSEELYAYDTDWAATGPLIERLGIGIYAEVDPIGRTWVATPAEHEHGEAHHQFGPTPLVAVCNLLLALKEAGKL
jgi:hypothetical protein